MSGLQSLSKTDILDLLETLPVAVYGSDLDGRVTFFNQAIVGLFGHEPEIGKKFWNGFVKPRLPKKVSGLEGNVVPVNNEELTIDTSERGRLNVLFSSKLMRDDSGNVAGVINTFINITDLKSLGPYHKMVEQVEDYAILLLDKDGNILNWNKGAEKIKGYKDDEIIGRNFKVFYGEEDQKRRLPQKLLAHAIRYGKAMHEGWRIRKGETRFWGSVVITALRNDQNEVIGFTKVTRDLTERKLAEDNLNTKAQELEYRNRELEQFAYVASHDLQEPLRKIQVFTDLLESHTQEKSSLKFLKKIGSSANRMSVLVRDVLRYAKLSQPDELFEKVDLNVVLRNVLSDFELLLEQKQVSIEYGILPVVRGIPVQLEQLFTNLISNAIKFNNNEPFIEINSYTVPEEELILYPEISKNQTYVKLAFKDNGIGFDVSHADEVFKLFKRLQIREPGTGIGLALCKKIVVNHGGHIDVSSEVNKGTIFCILLPIS